MKASIKFNDKAFAKTLADTVKFSSRRAPEVINHIAKDVAIGAIRYTDKASPSKIRANLKKDGLVYRLIRKTGLTREQIKLKAEAFIRARIRSIGYIKAGWYRAAQTFGARGGKVKPGGLADQGRGQKATSRNMVATMENHAVGAVEVSGKALGKAMDERRGQMMKRLQKKLGDSWGKRR